MGLDPHRFFLLFVSWQMFSTFNMSGGKVQIANHQWSDFGSTVSIMQSFAVGHNFPTEYPHFSGDRIRYHFLFYFQAGNLEYLGLNPALSNNILSILSLVSMLILVMTLGVVLFRSRAVGRIGAALFFFHGSLSFIPFLISQGSIGNALNAALTARDFLPSVFPYRGELWGVWSQVVFINQRHLATSVGLLLLVLIFLITRYRTALLLDEASHAPENNQMHDESEANDGAEPEDSKSGLLSGTAENRRSVHLFRRAARTFADVQQRNLSGSVCGAGVFVRFVSIEKTNALAGGDDRRGRASASDFSQNRQYERCRLFAFPLGLHHR
ncbi:MAG: hypothetical protein WKF71_06120 [Pyrinomonadaceae bacterium]